MLITIWVVHFPDIFCLQFLASVTCENVKITEADELCRLLTQEIQKRNMQLLTMHNVTSSAQVSTSQAVDTAEPRSIQHHRGTGAGTATGDMSLDPMTDDDSSRADALRPQRQRRHRGADDVFPTRTLQRYQVC